jgi:hypothetical protein
MTVMFVVLLAVCVGAERMGNPALVDLGAETAGNMEGKEVRFGVVGVGAVGHRDDGGLERVGQLDARQRTRRSAGWCRCG